MRARSRGHRRVRAPPTRDAARDTSVSFFPFFFPAGSAEENTGANPAVGLERTRRGSRAGDDAPLAPLAPLAHPASMPMAMSPMSAGAEPSNPHCHMSQLAALHALGDSARRQPLLPLEMRHEMRVMMPSVT